MYQQNGLCFHHCLRKVCTSWRSSYHAWWWRLASSERGIDQGHGNGRWIPPDLEVNAQHCINGASSLPPQQQGSQTLVKSQSQQQNPALLLQTQIPQCNDILSHFPKSWHHASHSRGSLLALAGVLEQQHCK